MLMMAATTALTLTLCTYYTECHSPAVVHKEVPTAAQVRSANTDLGQHQRYTNDHVRALRLTMRLTTRASQPRALRVVF